jgi:AAHS family 4-hydroxybenzoate transporter-like MFS transporter
MVANIAIVAGPMGDGSRQTQHLVDPSEVIDSQPISRLHLVTFGLCILTTFFDGYDIQAIALTAPLLVSEWNLAPSAFGPVFSVALVGFMVGQLLFGRLADRFGRRSTLIAAVWIFGTFTALCAAATDWWTLLLLRFPVGIGLGGAMPIVLTLSAELAPQRIRALVIGIISSGYCLGAIAGGYVAQAIAADGYWQGVFLVGGIGPIILSLAMLVWLPESPTFLAGAARHDKLRRVMRQIAPLMIRDDTAFRTISDQKNMPAVIDLFGDYRNITVTVWATYFLVLFCHYCLLSWLPVLVTQSGLSFYHATWALMAYNIGGAIGGILIGRFLDRVGPLVSLSSAYFFGAGLILTAAVFSGSWPAIAILMGAAGFFVIGGGQLGLATYTTTSYPPAIRSTGVGAALAFGRIGGIIGPLVGGLVLAAQVPALSVFTLVGVLGILTGLVFLKLAPRRTLA